MSSKNQISPVLIGMLFEEWQKNPELKIEQLAQRENISYLALSKCFNLRLRKKRKPDSVKPLAHF